MYIFTINKEKDKFLKIKKELQIGFTRNINNCSWWHNSKEAETWNSKILKKYPDAQLVEVGFVILK